MFDIDALIRIWCGGGIPGTYLQKLRAASKEELLEFRKKVKAHKKQPQKVQVAPWVTTEHGLEKFCIHDDICCELSNGNLLRDQNGKGFSTIAQFLFGSMSEGFGMGLT